ncbi:MAG: SET domain-containing protein [Jatrophihabitans sp.]
MTGPPGPDEQCWLHPDVALGPSVIAGRGLFAATDLGAGTVVSRLGGRLVGDDELCELLAADRYVDAIGVTEGVHLLLAPGSDNRFGNHSCEPNLGWAGEYTLVAMRDIATGDELTHDYATSTGDAGFVLYCHCETYRCRQVVEGTDWQIPQLQQRYASFWTPMLRRRIDGLAGASR